MGEYEQAKVVTPEEVLALFNKLKPEHQKQVRDALNRKYWKKHITTLKKTDFRRSASESWDELIYRIGKGDIDEVIKDKVTGVLKNVGEEANSLIEALKADPTSEEQAADPQTALEKAYSELQASSINIRSAVAQVKATEIQLEQQIGKERDQAATWFNRAETAAREGDEVRAEEARRRQSQHVKTAKLLTEELENQQETTMQLNARSQAIETKVQIVRSRKYIFDARMKASQAEATANDAFLVVDSNEQLNALFKEVKQSSSVQEEPVLLAPLNSKELLKKAIDVLERATAVIERLERSSTECDTTSKPSTEST